MRRSWFCRHARARERVVDAGRCVTWWRVAVEVNAGTVRTACKQLDGGAYKT